MTTKKYSVVKAFMGLVLVVTLPILGIGLATYCVGLSLTGHFDDVVRAKFMFELGASFLALGFLIGCYLLMTA